MQQERAIRDPHGSESVITRGVPLEEADWAFIFVHGRGATPEGILNIAKSLSVPDFALLAPGAARHTWYPHSFLAPIEDNEPYLSSALKLLDSLVERVISEGIMSERIMFLGFSQGACLTSEFIARNPRRYGGVAILTGGLIGPEGIARDYSGSLEGTPIFLGSSDPDAHVPRARVDESAEVFEGMGAEVTKRIYPGMGHIINDDELGYVQKMVDREL